jgi:hypothetical protein
MPHYEVVFENVSSTHHPQGWKCIEHVSAPDLATVDALVRQDAGRYVNVDQYKWSVREIPPPPKRTPRQR